MISILIPTYNHDVNNLTHELVRQGEALNITFEIIIFDDHSKTDTFNKQEFFNTSSVKYKYLSKNIGRSKIRNLLAKEAKYEFLLFLDADVFPENKKFLEKYVNSISANSQIIYGGRKHLSSQNSQLLRWKYGFYKEDKTAEERNKKPYISIITNNLLVKKEIFKTISFEEDLTKYGHEDTLFSFELKKIKANIQHINNPVIHTEIDSNQEFLNKTKAGLENLTILFRQKKIDPEFVTILSIFQKIKYFGLHFLSGYFFKIFEPLMKRNLLSKRSSLFVFNIYKLTYFCKINS